MKLRTLLILPLAVVLLSACSQGRNEAASYRHSIFHVIAWHFGALGAMAKGEQPFDPATFEKKANILAELSTLPWEGFQPDSAEGSDAKPAIWENRADFDSKAETFQNEARTLAQLAGEGDQQAMFSQVGEVGKACKACHQEYRKD